MPLSNDLAVNQLLTDARQLARNRQPDAAAPVFEEILTLRPGHTEASLFIAEYALHRRDVAKAVLLLEQALRFNQGVAPLHQKLAAALERLEAQPDAEQQLRAIVTALPEAYNCELFLGRLFEQRGDQNAAITAYFRAIKNAQLRGFWLNRDTTAPWLQARVARAMKVAHEGRRDWLYRLLEPMVARHGRDELTRVFECVAMFCGEKRLEYGDPRQKPSFLYFPGIPSQPLITRELLPFAESLEQQGDALRSELWSILENNDDVVPFHKYSTPEQAAYLFSGPPWQAYFFYRNGEAFPEHHLRCPHTSKTLTQLPMAHIRDHAPETCFSVLRPGTHILPHRGVTNTRSVLHLPLIVPEQCALNITGVGTFSWQQDRCFAFDDTYEHEAWNRSELTRVILLTDIWNPHLREAERWALKDLIEQIGDFNRATEATPPAPAMAGSPPEKR